MMTSNFPTEEQITNFFFRVIYILLGLFIIIGLVLEYVIG